VRRRRRHVFVARMRMGGWRWSTFIFIFRIIVEGWRWDTADHVVIGMFLRGRRRRSAANAAVIISMAVLGERVRAILFVIRMAV
jgi:hypothetical protein